MLPSDVCSNSAENVAETFQWVTDKRTGYKEMDLSGFLFPAQGR